MLATLAACAFGIGMALQLRDARRVSFDHAFRLAILGHLVGRPVWLAGVAVSGVGFLLQLVALHHGSVVTVQPIVSTALVVCLAVTARCDRAPLGRRTWLTVLAVTAGVATFLEAGGTSQALTTTVAVAPLVVTSIVLVLVLALCITRARASTGMGRAVTVGLGAGLANAYVAVLARAAAVVLRHGVAAALRSPYPYGMLLAAAIAVVLVQAIYQAGRPELSLPIAIFTETIGSVALAVGVLREHPVLSGARGTLAIVGLLLAVSALMALSRERTPVATSTADTAVARSTVTPG